MITCFHPFNQTLSYVAHLEIKICYEKIIATSSFSSKFNSKYKLVVNYLQVKLQAFKKQILVVSTLQKKKHWNLFDVSRYCQNKKMSSGHSLMTDFLQKELRKKCAYFNKNRYQCCFNHTRNKLKKTNIKIWPKIFAIQDA